MYTCCRRQHCAVCVQVKCSSCEGIPSIAIHTPFLSMASFWGAFIVFRFSFLYGFMFVYICGLPRENVPYGNFFKKYFLAVFARSMQDVSMGQSACSYPFPFLRYSMENVLAT